MNLLIVVIRFYEYSKKNPKPENVEEFKGYITHILNSTIIWFLITLIIF